MANAIEAALGRASEEQRIKAQQLIEEARRNIKLVSVQQMDDITPTAADAVARNAQVIQEAKRTIPFETMQQVDEIGSPMTTPQVNSFYRGSNVVELHPQTLSNIEGIEQGEGNNYLRENAVNRAMYRQPQPNQQLEQEQSLSR